MDTKKACDHATSHYQEAEKETELDGFNGLCSDCRQSKDNCPDCCEGELYLSPDSCYEMER